MKKILYGTVAAAALMASASVASAQTFGGWFDEYGYSSGYSSYERPAGGSIGYQENIERADPGNN